MKKRIGVISLSVVTALSLVLTFQWSNIFNNYSIRTIPGLKRIGAAILFPRAYKVAWESESSIVFTGRYFRGPGLPLYRHQINHGWPVKILPDFQVRDFNFTSDLDQFTFIGWNLGSNEIWITKDWNEPTPIEYGNDTLYDVISIDWTSDTNQVLVHYSERGKLNSFKVVNTSKRTIAELFSMENGDYPFDDIDWFADKVTYVTENTDLSINILDLQRRSVDVIKFDRYVFSNVRFLQHEPWLMATAGSNGKTEIALVNPVEGCIAFPFRDLTGIHKFDIHETSNNIKLVLTDNNGFMYILDMAEALGQPNISTLFSCESE